MRKKVAGLLVVGSSLLLTACSDIVSLEQLFGWREKFFIDLTPSFVDTGMAGVTLILVPFAVFTVSLALLRNLNTGVYPWLSSNVRTTIAILLTVMMIATYGVNAMTIGQKLFPDSLSLDYVSQNLRFGISLDLSKNLLVGMALTFTAMVPLVHSAWVVKMMFSVIFEMLRSMATPSIEGVVFFFAQILGWSLFPYAYSYIISATGILIGGWDNIPTRLFGYGFYMTGTVVSAYLFYILFPQILKRFAHRQISTQEVSGEVRPFNFSFDSRDDSSKEQSGDGGISNSYHGRRRTKDNAKLYREATPRLSAGQKHLESGSEDDDINNFLLGG